MKGLVCLLVALACSVGCVQGLRYVVTAPNTFRFGVHETIGISISGLGKPVDVVVYLQDQGKTKRFSSNSVKVPDGVPQITTVVVQPTDMPENTKFVHLIVNPTKGEFPQKEIQVPVTKHSGYAFVQTDKPLYLPGQDVQIRILSLNEKLLPNTEVVSVEITNPNSIPVLLDKTKPGAHGIASMIFSLPSTPIFGTWKISAHYGDKRPANSTISFEVKEYVLPTFSVEIKTPRTILSNAKTIDGTVTATYVYGQPVQGSVNLNYEILTNDLLKIPVGMSRGNKLGKNGQLKFHVDVNTYIKSNNIPWFPNIAGSKFVVEAQVTEQASGKSERAVDSSALFTTSPYIIVFPRARKDFRPGVPYQVQGDVRYANGHEIKESINILVESAVAITQSSAQRQLNQPTSITTDDRGRFIFQFDTDTKDQSLKITIKTSVRGIPYENQAKGTLDVQRYRSPDGQSYVWIATRQEQLTLKVDSAFNALVKLYPSGTITSLYYMVVSRGAILKFAEVFKQGTADIRSIQFTVTADMSPSARLIVFISKNGKIIADSMKLEVEKKCNYNGFKGLHLRHGSKQGIASSPGLPAEFEIVGESGSHIGIAGVDEALYTLDRRHILTKEKVFSEMDAHDLGCGPGGGETTEDVFRKAGMLILSDAAIGNHARLDDCKPKTRAKRNVMEEKLQQYVGASRVCCSIGFEEGPPGMNCSERARLVRESIADQDDCAKALLDCCTALAQLSPIAKQLFRQGWQKKNEVLGDGELITEEKDVVVRNIFPETLFFKTIEFGGPECLEMNEKGVCTYSFKAPHSITTWQIQAVAVSKTTGICVADPLPLRVFKPVFVQMDLPYSARRGEQIEVPATVFNYGPSDLNLLVYMLGSQGICMGRSDGERSEIQKIEVPSNSAKTVTFPVMPLEISDYELTVYARSSDGSDAIKKTLKVVHEGVKRRNPRSFVLDPTGFYSKPGTLEDGGFTEIHDANKQTIIVELDPPDNHVPGSGSCTVSVIGSFLGQAVHTTLTNPPEKLLNAISPSACGEQTTSRMVPLVYTMLFLKRSKQLSATAEANGYSYLTQGYNNLLRHRRSDSSFGYYLRSSASTWLTAYITRTMCQASTLIKIPQSVICSGMDWMLSRQQNTGAFHDSTQLRSMHGNDVAITSFVLIAVLECHQCSQGRSQAVSRAVTFLESQLDTNQQPYTAAIMAYALQLANSLRAGDAMDKLKSIAVYDESTNTRRWTLSDFQAGGGNRPWVFQNRPTGADVETTSYALLASLLDNDIPYTHPIAKWLSQQRTSDGWFVSTQDTVVALKALAEYSTQQVAPTPDMICNITSEKSGRKRRSFVVKSTNALILQETTLPVGGKLVLTTEGKGLGALTVDMQYNVDQTDKESCKFELTVKSSEYKGVILPPPKRPEFEGNHPIPKNVTRVIVSKKDYYKFDSDVAREEYILASRKEENNNNGPAKDVVELKICVRFLENQPAGMSILEIGLLTGYAPVEYDLQNITLHHEHTKTSHYELTGRSVVLYLDEVPHNRPLCFTLRTVKEIKVGKVQPTSVKIYDYYSPDKACTKFYRPDGKSAMLKKICEGRECTCLEGRCPSCNPFEDIMNIDSPNERLKALLDMACDQYHYVWDVNFLRSFDRDDVRIYEVKVKKVLNEGMQTGEEVEGTVVQFSGQGDCKCPNMTTGETYVIMGSDTIKTVTEEKEDVYKYVFPRAAKIYHSQKLGKFKNRSKEQDFQRSFNQFYNRLVLGCVS